eukprot:352726-Chlamydomonas_euryale.AAC.6
MAWVGGWVGFQLGAICSRAGMRMHMCQPAGERVRTQLTGGRFAQKVQLALAGWRCPHLQVGDLDYPHVCGDAVAGLDNDNVARHELLCGDRQALAASHDVGRCRKHGLDGVSSLLSLALLEQTDGDVDDDDGQNERCAAAGGARAGPAMVRQRAW